MSVKHLLTKYFVIFFLCISVGGTANEATPPKGFVWQDLELTGGKLLKPNNWHFREAHGNEQLRWTVSKEDPDKRNGGYDTGVAVNVIPQVENSENVAKQLVNQILKKGEVLRTCGPEQVGNMFRACIELIESHQNGKEYHVLYTIMWWSNSSMIAYTSAGTFTNKWNKYRDTFDVMSVVELVSAKSQ